MVISFDDFKKQMSDLSILTGKTPTAYGKVPKEPKKFNYMIEVYHQTLRHHDHADIASAFQDARLRQEIVDGFGLNVNVIEKYVLLHRNRRTGKHKDEQKDFGKFNYDPPADCAQKLKSHGIDVHTLANNKSI